ncbi:carbohydrate ABC transporter permease [Actinotalea sp. C106]|uniref:carbohydrate ABC transporter permease n=1 Tax=Actinotalea sp. C106 TaxID=2908644 RepID=UPI002028F946|nr:carbohydrate ABC transporter permease [Actinotalea sp. C106]
MTSTLSARPAPAPPVLAPPAPAPPARRRPVLRTGARRRRPPLLAPAVVVIGVVLAVVPLLYLFSVSLMGRNELVAGVLVPSDPQWSNWSEAVAGTTLTQAVLNSVLAAVGGALLSLALALPGAWALSRRGTGGRTLLATVMSPWLLPPIVAVVPLLTLLRILGLTNSLLGLTLVYGLVNLPVAVWLLQAFLHRIPGEIDEAAQLDGAGPLRVLTSIVLPLAGPSLVAVGLIVTLLGYSEFLLASFLTQDAASQTLPVHLSLLLGERVAEYGKIAAAAMVGILPVLVIALTLQRRLVEGLTAGAVK